jgi:two-component system nitrogen regulation sensor histidine kinase NtrY
VPAGKTAGCRIGGGGARGLLRPHNDPVAALLGAVVQAVARSSARSHLLRQFLRLWHERRMQTVVTLGLVVLGPILAVLTFLALGPFREGVVSLPLRLILIADLIYVLAVAALVAARLLRIFAARRAAAAGSRLHLRLSGLFALIALVPTVLVAVFAGLTINVGLEGWFSERVRNAVGNSLAAAEAYEAEHRRDLVTDAEALAAYLNLARQAGFFLGDGELRLLLTQGQGLVQRGLREAFVIDGAGEIRARGDRSYLFDFDRPSAEDLARAAAGETVIIGDWDASEFRALVRLDAYVDRYLYVSRDVDGAILALLDETQETVRLYHQLEAERGRILFEFALLYLGFALILILASVWLGLWFAERLAQPVGRLVGAAQRVGTGDFDTRVPEAEGDDEIDMLGRVFNTMTAELKDQRDALLESHRQTEMRRRLFDSVLASVTAGVIGLDAAGEVEFVNRAGQRLLDLPETCGGPLAAAVPEFATAFERLRGGAQAMVQEELRLTRRGKAEILLVRMARREGGAGRPEGYVIAFDDVTDLVSAQRMAAWGDVARRIAHEIKNPLTPIQLSAERIRRRFAPKLDEDGATAMDSYIDVIVRQTGDLRRIVDEFSRFARMPEPDRREEDLIRLVRDAVILQESGLPGVRLVADLPEAPLPVEVDATMIGQALTNLIKNAGEAIETLQERGAPAGHAPEVRISLLATPQTAEIRIADNGIGLPEDRARLFEPYVTTRARGTGLGLPIVKKIVEEHGGTLALADAEPFGGSDRPGAMAVIRLPRPGRSAARAAR